MKIFIAGGTGFVGIHLVRTLVAEGHDIDVLARSEKKKSLLPPQTNIITGTPLKRGGWQNEINKADAVINLTGVNIFARWTSKMKKLIHESRMISTSNIVEAISPEINKKITFINASAAGYYGFCGDEEKYEDAPPGNDFLAQVCVAWEAEARKAIEKGARVITTRFGVVIGENGGALAKMLPSFRLGIAGKLGHGKQWFPWIHINDLCNAILFLINHYEISGPVNFCTPHPVRNIELTKTLGKILHRPTLIPFPRFVAKLILGELASVIFEGNKMMPGVLAQENFSFRYPFIEDALRDILQ